MIRKTLALLAVCLVPAAAHGFACIQWASGRCIYWTGAHTTLRSFLGSPGTTLSNGTTTWDQNAINAANDWNDQGGFHFDVFPTDQSQFINPCGPQGAGHVCPNTGPLGDNPIFFATSECGTGFGDILELTINCWNSGNGAMLNVPVLVNANVSWNAYDGPLRASAYDIRRVLLHEFGHVLGLDHPDAHGQTVVAIMNSHVSDLYTLQADDIDGLHSLYPGSAPPPSSAVGTTGCQVDRRPARGTAWLLALLAAVVVPLRRRHRRNAP